MAGWNCRMCRKESEFCLECFDGSMFEKMNKADEIRDMDNEEMAIFFANLIKDAKVNEYSEDAESWLQWLETEVKE